MRGEVTRDGRGPGRGVRWGRKPEREDLCRGRGSRGLPRRSGGHPASTVWPCPGSPTCQARGGGQAARGHGAASSGMTHRGPASNREQSGDLGPGQPGTRNTAPQGRNVRGRASSSAEHKPGVAGGERRPWGVVGWGFTALSKTRLHDSAYVPTAPGADGKEAKKMNRESSPLASQRSPC